jgi:hypothetical protein
MIAALAITLYLECGIPDRLLMVDGDEWRERDVTPVAVYAAGDHARWDYYVVAKNWELSEINRALESGVKIEEKDLCDPA